MKMSALYDKLWLNLPDLFSKYLIDLYNLFKAGVLINCRLLYSLIAPAATPLIMYLEKNIKDIIIGTIEIPTARY